MTDSCDCNVGLLEDGQLCEVVNLSGGVELHTPIRVLPPDLSPLFEVVQDVLVRIPNGRLWPVGKDISNYGKPNYYPLHKWEQVYNGRASELLQDTNKLKRLAGPYQFL
jgi:hypothetical protein